MTVDQTKLINCLKALELKPHSYSSAKTNNKACIGVTIHIGQSAKFLPSGHQMDSLFDNYISYWPDVPWPDDYNEGEHP